MDAVETKLPEIQVEPEAFLYKPDGRTIADASRALANLATMITNLPVNTDHILYRRLLLTLGDLYAEYARWITPNTPAKPIESDEVPF